MFKLKSKIIEKIIIIRNDKLGDFVLSLPSFSLVKTALPNAEVVALVPSYTKQLADSFWAIDRVIIEPQKNAGIIENLSFMLQLRREKFDISITLYSSFRTGWQLFLANINKRFAPATKISQIFHNKRLRQRRSLSQKPEFEYNTDLVQYFLAETKQKIPELPCPPYMTFDSNDIQLVAEKFYASNHLPEGPSLIFLHPNSGGSASNLSLQQYAELANCLAQKFKVIFILTAGPGELDYVTQLSALLPSTLHHVYESRSGLRDFSIHLALAKLFISGSTGPLHIAGALNIPTVGFYPKHRSATPLRWQTLNSPERRLAFTPPKSSGDQNMSAINVESVANKIAEKYSGLFP